jgi:hypothetical protein
VAGSERTSGTGEGASSTLTVPALQDTPLPAQVAPVPATPRPESSASPGLPPDAETPHHALGVWRTTGLIAAGVGAVGLGVGAGFGLDAISKKSAADGSGCSSNECSPGAASTRDAARNSANMATVFFTAGGVIAAAGLGLWLFGPSGSSQAVVATVAPGGFVVAGSW